jgi:hypothetical protein
MTDCNCNWLHACQARVEQLEWEVKGVEEWREMYLKMQAENTLLLNKLEEAANCDREGRIAGMKTALHIWRHCGPYLHYTKALEDAITSEREKLK